jgi:hypothetical protein
MEMKEKAKKWSPHEHFVKQFGEEGALFQSF